MQMHYRDDLDSPIADPVNDSVGESRDAALAPRVRNHAVSVRMRLNKTDSLGSNVEEAATQTRSLALIVPGRFHQFRPRFRMKPVLHPFRPSAASLKT